MKKLIISLVFFSSEWHLEWVDLLRLSVSRLPCPVLRIRESRELERYCDDPAPEHGGEECVTEDLQKALQEFKSVDCEEVECKGNI